MRRQLPLPIDDCRLSAGCKAARYKAKYNIQHDGWDLGSESDARPLWGMGNGAVIAAGMDGAHAKGWLGNCLASSTGMCAAPMEPSGT